MEIMFNDMMEGKRLVNEGTNAWNNNFNLCSLKTIPPSIVSYSGIFPPLPARLSKIKFNPGLNFKSIL